MNVLTHPKIRHWLAEPLSKDVARSLERLADEDDVAHVAVMPDVHLSHDVCVGVAVATRSLLYPSAVGTDIGCGMAAVRFQGLADSLADERTAGQLLAGLYRCVPSMRQSRTTMPRELPEELQSMPLSHPKLEKLKSRDGRVQLGTLGRGNHFLEFQRDAAGFLWLMVHSGSRGIGQAIASHHLAILASKAKTTKLAAMDATSQVGRAYLTDLRWAVCYAESNRRFIIRAASEVVHALLGFEVDPSSLVQGNHNHVRRETHFDQELWVHRKGALSARDGEYGLIPGSMGTASFHVVGRGCPAALRSSSHGAGRSHSRAEAMKSIGTNQLLREMQGIWFDQRQANRLRDEAPSAYKDIFAVMRAQRELTRIDRELRPLLSYKGT